ncbi:MAG: HAD-IC family P-type ATPase, partial [Elusimicrobiota bacterium]
LPGSGVRARVGDKSVAVGARHLMEEIGADFSGFSQRVEELSACGKSVLYLAVDGRPAALLAVADPLREGARRAVAELKGSGRRVVLLTGDSEATAAAVAAAAGIEDISAALSPQGKAAAVRLLQREGRVVFVGDGINDAPALAQAEVGVAVGSGADVAVDTAEVVLLSARPESVPRAIALSEGTVRCIRQNLFWAFVYNALLIPVAAGVLEPRLGISLSPMLAAAAMSLSSVFVVANSLRLRSFG